jgi:propionyl-CoA carboxylase beta chain
VNIIFKREIEKAKDPAKKRAKLIEEYRKNFANPYIAAERGYIDDILEPAATRARLIRAFETLKSKRDSNPPKKHGNIPL